MAAEASAIVSQIRFEEQQTIWTSEFEDELAHSDVDYYPGMMFTHAKGRMEKTRLWEIIKKMPKGALLHCHYEAMVDTDWLIDQVLETPGLYIEAAAPLTSENLSTTTFMFSYAESSETSVLPIWSRSYEADTQISVKEASKTFPVTGEEGFRKWLRSRFTFRSENHHEGLTALWERFSAIFLAISALFTYEPILRGSLRRTFKQLLNDGIQYVDIRKAMLLPLRREQSMTVDSDQKGVLAVIEEEIEKFKQSEEGHGFWGARLIWTNIRRFGKQQIIESRFQTPLRHLWACRLMNR